MIGGDNTASILRNNYNASTNGGAVNVLLGGEIMMNENTFVEHNFVKDSADDKQHHGSTKVRYVYNRNIGRETETTPQWLCELHFEPKLRIQERRLLP